MRHAPGQSALSPRMETGAVTKNGDPALEETVTRRRYDR